MRTQLLPVLLGLVLGVLRTSGQQHMVVVSSHICTDDKLGDRWEWGVIEDLVSVKDSWKHWRGSRYRVEGSSKICSYCGGRMWNDTSEVCYQTFFSLSIKGRTSFSEEELIFVQFVKITDLTLMFLELQRLLCYEKVAYVSKEAKSSISSSGNDF